MRTYYIGINIGEPPEKVRISDRPIEADLKIEFACNHWPTTEDVVEALRKASQEVEADPRFSVH